LLGLYSATPKKGHPQERLSQKWNIPETLIFEELFQWISMSLKIEITILLHFGISEKDIQAKKHSVPQNQLLKRIILSAE
jgi:hypothetical protein